MKMPAKKGERPPASDETTLRTYLQEVIDYVEAVTSTRFDFHFSQNISFECGKCDQKVVRNRDLLKDGDVVRCQNPNCIASYIAHIKDGEFTFEPYQIPLDCKTCGQTAYIEAKFFREMKTDEGRVFVCENCGSRHLVRWLLKYALEAEANK